MKLVKLLTLLGLTAVFSCAQLIPVIKGKALDDSEIILPNPGSREILILIVGFTQKSGKVCEAWSKKIAADYHAETRVAYFSLPVLEDVPSLIRPLIVHGIRKSIPADERHRFVPINSNEPEWKKLVNFSSSDDAYLVVAMPDGHPVWQAHGAYSDAMYGDLKKPWPFCSKRLLCIDQRDREPASQIMVWLAVGS